MSKRFIVIWTFFILAGTGITIFLTACRGNRNYPVRTTGIVEGTEVNLSSEIQGRIVEICCQEGETINEGATAIKLWNEDLTSLVDQAQAGLERAQAEVKVAESAIDSARANMRSAEADIRNAEADMERARVQMEDANRTMERLDALYKEDIIAKEEMDSAVTAYEAAAANYNALKAKVGAAYSKRDATLAQLKTTENQSISALAAIKQAEANLSYNQAKLAYTTINSPISGTVVFKAFEKGETVTPGATILTIVDLQNLWVRVDLEETDIGKVVMGSDALITIEGLPGTLLKGKVMEIGRYGGFATQRDVTNGRQDIKTFRVKIQVVDPDGVLKPGMTVNVEIPVEVAG